MGIAKNERNQEIKNLFASGMTQQEIADKFNITQGRVSAIIYDRLPTTRYCRRCGTGFKHSTVSLCAECKALSLSEKLTQKEYRSTLMEERNKKRRERIAKTPKSCRTCNQSFFGFKRRICDECGPKKKDRVCRDCKKEGLGYRRRLCDGCSYTQPKRLCALCQKPTSSSWRVCIDCCPYRDRSKKNSHEGRDGVRALVRARDNYTCQDCGVVRTRDFVEEFNSNLPKGVAKGKIKSLDVHHLDGLCGKLSKGYDSAEMLPKLITLCHSCHFNRPEHRVKSKEYAENLRKLKKKRG